MNTKKLVIVESPAKAKTINNYLGDGFRVTASFGHVRDLPSSELGVDVKHEFKPTYIVIPKSRKNVSNIKKMAKESDEVYLATDLDREGEAIAWHVVQAAGLQNPKSKSQNSKLKRITFHEITKEAVQEALKHPRGIDMHLVDAQQARRVLDRLFGYNLSPLLWKKVYKGLSAGRVQSVALRLVVEREREVEKFKPEEYWTILALLEKDKIVFEARLAEVEGKKVDKLEIKSEKEAQEIIHKLTGGDYKVKSVEDKEEVRHPSSPFVTSTMQQEAHNLLGYSAKQTMRLAQILYEDGYITYMRTDSVNLSESALNSTRKYIKEKYGDKYLPEVPRRYQTKTKLAQEAHEAIRPAYVSKIPEQLAGKIDARALKLYELIWRRTVASQMKEAILAIRDVKIENKGFLFVSSGQTIKFKGWLELYPYKITQIKLPPLEVGEIADLKELKKEQHFTEPPARYSEATLIKALEERGIGRPSTYAPTMDTIQERGYVIKEKGRLIPEDVGKVVSDLLVENFPEVVDYDFTARIEDELDEIADGKKPWPAVVGEFYEPFSRQLEKKEDKIKKQNMDEVLEEKCPKCGKNLVIKHSRRGKFVGCTGFPDCDFTKPYLNPEDQKKLELGEKEIAGRKCPQCGHQLKVIPGKYGPFIGCSNYPKCKHMEKIRLEEPPEKQNK